MSDLLPGAEDTAIAFKEPSILCQRDANLDPSAARGSGAGAKSTFHQQERGERDQGGGEGRPEKGLFGLNSEG